MAEKQLSAAVRPQSRVRRRVTPHTGVTHVRRRQPDRYTIIGNHLAQHRELSLTAVGLATYILSLPEGASVDIRTLAARFPEGRDRIAFALRELEAQGYLARVRERTAGGRVITRTYAYNDPAAAAPTMSSAGRVGAGAGAGAGEPRPARTVPPVPVRSGPVPPAPVLPAPPVAPAPPEPPEPPRTPQYRAAVVLLAGLRRSDDRLTLAERDIRRLAPALAAWLDNGASPAAVQRTLTARLPADLENPAGLLAHRLRELLPPPLPEASVAPAAPRPHPLQTCDGCERAFRALRPGLCRDCRPAPPTSADTACAA
ncbi:helix-turn-helix domain-containing protein [Streptomyces gilvosporeus]|uniref:Helix-turn-helix domain-containing protein n=1 Tax=Streptomyces gilvosporeus TaxID=553510 RepID=A0A1V0U311_9ACTN|nr:helix-turn-helix domain-containing protein [Streptomyces gilvosporeus]ARF59566.1 helix-turn-helix domain-containing protein [Streptomyces gilvosporeus]